MKKAFLLFIYFLLSNVGKSQTIINAESLLNGVDSTIFSLSFLYNGNRGNMVTDQVHFASAFVLIKEKNDFKIFGGYDLLSQSENKLLNGGYIHLRHNFKLSKGIKTFEFYQLQFNDVLILKKREVYGLGLRFHIINRDSLNSNFSVGVMKEQEILNENFLLQSENAETNYYRLNTVLGLQLILSETLKIDNVFYYQPYFKEFEDYRILNELRFTTKLSNKFNLITAMNIRYDNKPPGLLEKTDLFLHFGFNLLF